MRIAYNPLEEEALSQAPSNDDITFDLPGKCIYAKSVQFKGTDTTYQVFKKNTSSQGGGYNGLVPAPDYLDSNSRYLREDGEWITPESQYKYAQLNGTDLNTLKTEGRWYFISGSSNNTNGPNGLNSGSELYVGRNASGYRYQKAILITGEIWFRTYNNSAWGSWTRQYTNGEARQTMTSDNTLRPIVLGYTNGDNTSKFSSSINQVYASTSIYANPASGTLSAKILTGRLVGSIDSNTTATTQKQSDNSTKVATTEFVRVAVADLVNGAPETLDTLKEIADYLQDESVAGGIVQQLAKKVNKTGDTMSGDLSFASIGNWPTESDDEFPIDSKGLKWTGSSDNASIFYRITASDKGHLVFQTGDDSGTSFIWENQNTGTLMELLGTGNLTIKGQITAPTFIGNLQGTANTATALTTNAGSSSLPVYFSGGKPIACTKDQLFSSLANVNNKLSITIAGQNRELIVGYSVISSKINGATISTYDNLVPSNYIDNGEITGLHNNNSSTETNGFPAPNTSGAILFGKTNGAVLLASQAGQSDCSIYLRQYYTSWGDWVKLLHSRNTFINKGSITINGTSIKPLVSLQTLTFAEGEFSPNSYNGTAAKTINIPTKTSHLTNDSGFITQETLNADLITIEKNLKVTQAWMDTGIQNNNLETGTYIVQVTISSGNNSMWSTISSGIMSWRSDNVNDSETDEIILHRTGHAYHNVIYLRTVLPGSSSSGIKLQIASSSNFVESATITFKFRKMI